MKVLGPIYFIFIFIALCLIIAPRWSYYSLKGVVDVDEIQVGRRFTMSLWKDYQNDNPFEEMDIDTIRITNVSGKYVQCIKSWNGDSIQTSYNKYSLATYIIAPLP